MPYRRKSALTPMSAIVLAMAGLLCGPIQAAPATAEDDEKQILPADPRAVLKSMADQLDQQPDFVVLELEGLPITQRDAADIIRGMPLGMAVLKFPEVYRMSLEVAVRQKAMVLHARQERLDKDPTVIHRGQLAFERVLADAWLNGRADAAVTEKALRERYDRDVAGKPGPEQVRASVILLPTMDEARTVIARLQSGADFNDLARQFSKDPTAPNGGDLGYVTRDGVSPEISAVMFSLTPGETTRYPVPAQAGFFVIRVSGHSYHKTPTFEEARAALERDIRTDAIKDAIGTLMSNIKFFTPTKPGEKAIPAPEGGTPVPGNVRPAR